MTDQNEFESESFVSTTVDSSLTIKRLFIVWLKIGFTSFGGGAITQYLIQENFIYKRKWITTEEYANIIGMCQVKIGRAHV
jgi:chromate transporter